MSADVMNNNLYAPVAGRAEDLAYYHQIAAGSMPYLTQQYALPIHHQTAQGGGGDVSALRVDHAPSHENTLRRKTPNGTLSAGYHAVADDPNPQKHQLVPLSESNPSRYLHAPMPNVKRTFLQHQQQRADSAPPATWTDPGNVAWPVPHHGQPRSPFPVMDSMLQQMPGMQSYNSQEFYAQTVPSVLQPSLQHLGPTASGVQDSGPYGPYWHDGTFVPYRPAALRDPRFYPNNPSHSPLPSSLQQIQHQQHSWQQTPGVQQWQMQNAHALSSQTLVPSHVYGGYVDPMPTQTHQSLYDGASPLLQTDPHASQQQKHDGGQSYAGFNARSEHGAESMNVVQRDETFEWALRLYTELLQYIQTARRQQQQQRHAYGQPQLPHRPSFYPKPPKPSHSFPLVAKRQPDSSPLPDATDAKQRTSLLGPDTGHAGSEFSGTADGGIPLAKLRASSVWSPSALAMHDNEYQRRASHDQYQRTDKQWPYPAQQHAEMARNLRRTSGSVVSTTASPHSFNDAVPSNALLALQHITKLCQETRWQWVDGMHLGGCLAYALGQYQRALRFYTKVLDIDPKHLEATSNLAATLLALGRKQEAEQHWMSVVQAAPSHFEAVEHLIGMLCNEQRSKEAVKVIEYVEKSLRQQRTSNFLKVLDKQSECSSSTASRSPCISEQSDKGTFDFEADGDGSANIWKEIPGTNEPGFGSSGFAIPGSDNGRMLALIHAKGNMLYGLGDNGGAARAFEDAVLIAVGRKFNSVQGLVEHILAVVSLHLRQGLPHQQTGQQIATDHILLSPEQALATAKLCFSNGALPGLTLVPLNPQLIARKAVISTTSNSLLSLAKIFQDSMSNSNRSAGLTPLTSGVRDILALYYLSLSLQPSPSTANNVGIILASVQQKAAATPKPQQKIEIPGVVPGSGIALALQYYNYGLQLDQNHAHLYTNLGSLLKDIGQLDAAINMYERAVKCDAKFDIALANLANAVKDKGRINDAIVYYKRAVDVNPDFAEAVCGLANALNSVCSWHSRGGIATDNGRRDRWHVDPQGMLLDGRLAGASSTGWIKRVIQIVERQLVDGESWGCGALSHAALEEMVRQVTVLEGSARDVQERAANLHKTLAFWAGQKWEGARVTRLVERATRRIGWHRYRDTYIDKQERTAVCYDRPKLPTTFTVPTAPTVLPFHTFTSPMSAKQIRMISQRNGYRISVSTLRAPWLPKQVYPPPKPPAPYLRVGYVSSDFNNHPLAHLMQSVFGMHDQHRVKAYCYATTSSDNSVHRQQIENEAPVFHDASSWATEKLVDQIVDDGIHVLVNLNGYTRGARNEVFAARPAPIQMSFMGFAGTLGAEWCDYLLADETAIPPGTLRPWRRNVDLEDQMVDENNSSDNDDWVYGENIIYCRDTFFCCDHRQSAPDASVKRCTWEEEQKRRWKMRKELFPQISDDTIIFGNFNQLYKIEPTTFRTWLRILARVPNSVLWLLRFPDLGESHLLNTARLWAGPDVASRVIFTDVAPKHLHISRARVCDLVLDTAECNAHTTAADVLWSGTPLLTLPRYEYKMCSRMAASILKGALPRNNSEDARRAAKELIASSEEDYEEKAVALAKGFVYPEGCHGTGQGRLMDLRKLLYGSRWTSALFDTKRWVGDLEDAYEEAWRRWVSGEGGDIWLDQVPRGGGKGGET